MFHPHHGLERPERVCDLLGRDGDGQRVAVAQRLPRRHDVRNDVVHLENDLHDVQFVSNNIFDST